MYYQDLDAWKEAIKLVKKIYEITNKFPQDEIFGIVSQVRRASISIPSNIAEGAARFSDKESLRFMEIALGSIAEVETQLIIAKELGFVNNIYDELESLKKVNAMTLGLKKFYDKNQT
ncbi:four helix bundle protein [bacterium]|nr:four helix bundle protein [bacterium]